MKKLLLSVTAVTLLTIAGHSQIVARVLAPAGIAGNKDFTWADNWGATPDFNTPGVFVQDTLVFVEDGSSGTNPQGNPVSQEGCNPLQNAAQVQGKIAVCYRNTCEFGAKAMNAQNAGAVAIIIINRDPEVIPMGAGAQGANVTIPVVMLTSVDGAAIKTAITNMQTVVMFLGNKQNVFANDLAVSEETAFSPRGGHNTLLGNFTVKPAIEVTNIGSANQSTASINAKIVNSSSVTVYDETIGPFSINSAESIVFATGSPQEFPVSNNLPVGSYELIYTASLGSTTDEDAGDNVITYPFTVNATHVSGATMNGAGVPNATYFRVLGNATYTQYKECITMNNVTGTNLGITEVNLVPYTDVAVNDLANAYEILISVYTYTPVSGANPWGLDGATSVSSSAWYTSSNAQSGVSQTIDIPNVALVAGNSYLVCMETEAHGIVGFGYDGNVNYDGNYEFTTLPVSPVFALNPNIPQQWYNSAFGNPIAMSAKVVAGVGLDENTSISAQAFPNPAKDQVKVRLNAAGTAQIVVTDITGKVVMNTESNINAQLIDLNTSTFEAGMYVVNITTQDGIKTQLNIVIE